MAFNIRSTRMLAPAAGRPALELCHWPLYSCAVLNGNTTIGSATALPRQVSFFNYALGSQVSGNDTSGGALANATRWHTNMETANFLAAPKTMTVTAIRVVVSQLAHGTSPSISDASGGASATAGTTLAQHAHDVRALQQYALRFFVGPKDYLQAPLYAVPSNAGVGGVAANSFQATATTGAYQFQRTVGTHIAGRSWSLDKWPVLIANQQSFGAELLCSFDSTVPSSGITGYAAGNAQRLIQSRAIFVVLEGILGREVA